MSLLLEVFIASVVICASAEGQITLEKLEVGNFDIVTVKDARGNVLETIESHFSEGYEIIKPSADDDHVCLINQFQTDDHTDYRCYRQEPAPEEASEEVLRERIQTCRDREVFMLIPTECENGVGSDETDLEKAMIPHGRQKRCTWIMEKITRCAETGSKCVKWGGWLWSKCISYQYYCKRYTIKEVQVWKC